MEVIDRLCNALSNGMPIQGACVVAGIGVTTLSEWREVHPEIEVAMSEAREHARLKALSAIKNAGQKDWRAHAEWLRLTFPADYRGSKVEVTANAYATAKAAPVLSEERRLMLIKRIQAATPPHLLRSS